MTAPASGVSDERATALRASRRLWFNRLLRPIANQIKDPITIAAAAIVVSKKRHPAYKLDSLAALFTSSTAAEYFFDRVAGLRQILVCSIIVSFAQNDSNLVK